jgi:HEPN domain-containing protein
MSHEREQALIQETQAVWRERYERLLSEEDAKEIISNARQLFNLLEEWDRS